MRISEFHVEGIRVWFNIVVIILFTLLFVFPKPIGIVFDSARILIVIAVTIGLFWQNFSGSSTKLKQAPNHPSSASERLTSDNHTSSRSRHEYDQLLLNIFDLIYSRDDSFECAVYMVDPMSNGFTLQKGSAGYFTDFVPSENEIISTILNQDEGVLLQQKDAANAWKMIFNTEKWVGSECILGNRIIYRDVTVGCILVVADHFNKLEERDREIISSLGKFISSGIEKIERSDELISDRENHVRISSLMNSVDIADSTKDIYGSVLALCRSLFSYDKLTISIAENKTDTAFVQLVDGFTEDIDVDGKFNIAKTLHGRPIRTAEIINSSSWENDYDDDGRFENDDSGRYNFMSVLGVPMRVGPEHKGAIVLERLTSRGYTESDSWLLESLSQTLGNILAWNRKYQVVHQNATHDGLTELLNHKSFLERFEEEISRSLRFQQDLVILMMDLDKFKNVNDTHGHLYGDYVLSQVSKTLKSCIRNIDVIARYGGEEFAILLINTNKKKAEAVARRIVKSVAGFKFNKDDIKIRVTISVGLAQFPNDADRIKDLIAKADAAMYKVKGIGGNNFMLHEGIA